MLKLISSMATRQVLAELAAGWQKTSGIEVVIESVGGVDAAKRVQAGEAFDGVVLASDAIDKLMAGGHAVAGSRTDLVLSSVAIAVRAGAPAPDISSEAALRSAIEAAPTIGYSTGPSGTALVKQFERWGILEAIRPRIVQAPPGVPVGKLVAQGEVALGFQQFSELMHLDGITVIGSMPAAVAIDTIFSAATCTVSTQGEALGRLFAFMASPDAAAIKTKHGMAAA
ncbi:MAG: substrate-binding domain-containing protein [Pseudomonadota bacterium]